jgi:hypothetical protein
MQKIKIHTFKKPLKINFFLNKKITLMLDFNLSFQDKDQ